MGRILSAPRVIRSVSLSYEFDSLCRQYSIPLSEALRIGVSLMLGDLGVKDYDNNLNLHRKMKLFQEQAEKLSQELLELKAKAGE